MYDLEVDKEVLPKPSSHPAGGAAEILTDLGKPSSHSAGGAAEILTDLGKPSSCSARGAAKIFAASEEPYLYRRFFLLILLEALAKHCVYYITVILITSSEGWHIFINI